MRLSFQIIALALISCASLPGYSAGDRRNCSEPNGDPDCAASIEDKVIKLNPGVFSRKEKTLNVRLQNGKNTSVVSVNEGNPADYDYYLVAYYPEIDYCLLEQHIYDGLTYFLLNMLTGDRQEIEGFAVLSPDKKRLAVYQHSGIDGADGGIGRNVLKVYRLHSGRVEMEFNAEDLYHRGPDDLRWESNQEIRFTMLTVELTPTYHIGETKKSLVYKGVTQKGNAVWKIE